MLSDITSKDYITLKTDAEDKSRWQKSLSCTIYNILQKNKKKKHLVRIEIILNFIFM